MRRNPFLFAIAIVVALAGLADQAKAESEFGVWNALFGSAQLTDSAQGPVLWFDTHGRRGEAGTVAIVRPGIGLSPTSWLTVHAGYAWIPTWDDAADARSDEHRIWEQAVLVHTIGPISLQSRTRFEQRLSEVGDDTALRLREFVRLGWQQPGGALGLVLWDESFWGLNDTDWTSAGFDQNRLFVGVSHAPARNARLEVGYLFVHLDRDPDRRTHALAANLFVTLRP